MKIVFCFFAILYAFISPIKAQDIDLTKFNIDSIYKRADSIAFSVPFTTDIIAATHALVKDCKTNLEKFRVLFRWVAEHIEYDVKLFNKGLDKESGLSIECKDKNDCDLKYHNYYFEYCKTILNKKAAICDGYARLYKVMCDLAKLPCEVVEGYGKTHDWEIGTNGRINHAWNAILLGKDWYFLDATWAAGGCDWDEEKEKLLPFQKSFRGWYFLKDYKQFLLDHYPNDVKWLLELKTHLKSDFYQQPFYYTYSIESVITQQYHEEKGIINIHSLDTLLCFTYKLSPSQVKALKENGATGFTIGYKTNKTDKEITYPEETLFKNKVHFCVPLEYKTPSYLIIYFNDVPAIKYKLRYHF
jgi:Transglutaminase-like superfamily